MIRTVGLHRSASVLVPLAALVMATGSASAGPQVGNVFYIEMENHNFTQPAGQTQPQQIFGNPAAPYLNSLITPGNPNAAQTSYASNYHNVGRRASTRPSRTTSGRRPAPTRRRSTTTSPFDRGANQVNAAEPQRPAPGRRHLLEVVPGGHRPRHGRSRATLTNTVAAAEPVDRPAQQLQRHVAGLHQRLQRQPPVQLRHQARRPALLHRHQRRQRPRPHREPRGVPLRPAAAVADGPDQQHRRPLQPHHPRPVQRHAHRR